MEEFDLEPGEEIITSVRQHLLVLFFKLIPLLLLAFAPLLLLGIFSLNIFSGAEFQTTRTAISNFQILSDSFPLFYGAYLIFIWMAIFTVLTRYHLTVWIITSTRIVDIQQSGFFTRKVSSFLLLRVQDVTTDVSGIFATFFGYGDLHVETAGRDENFNMHGIKDPVGVRDIIMREIALLHQTSAPARDAL